MIAQDILYLVSNKTLSEIEADAVLDEILDSNEAKNAQSLLMMNKTEWTAKCQGAEFTVLAEWRYKGWPNKCVMCSRNIDINSFGWKVIDLENNTSVLRHIKC